MAERISKTQRWLDLVAYLVRRRLPVSVEELMEAIPAYRRKWRTGDETSRASARRQFERDKDELREAGIPIETITFRVNYGMEEVEGYRLARRDFYLPYLRLVARESPERPGSPSAGPAGEVAVREEDAALALDALRRIVRLPDFPLHEEARWAFRKLAFDLDPGDFPETPVLFVEHPDREATRERVRALSEALMARKRARFRYHGIHRDEPTEREVEPYGLLFQHDHWYLVGRSALRDDLRVFRTGRMQDVEVNSRKPHTPDYEIPADFTMQDFLSREAWELGEDEEPIEARVRFEFPTSLWAERNGHGERVETGEDGSHVRRFRIRQVDPFLRWILSLEGEARILAPPALARELGRMAARVAALYAGTGGEEEAGAGDD